LRVIIARRGGALFRLLPLLAPAGVILADCLHQAVVRQLKPDRALALLAPDQVFVYQSKDNAVLQTTAVIFSKQYLGAQSIWGDQPVTYPLADRLFDNARIAGSRSDGLGVVIRQRLVNIP